ncbi:hypothetical protein CEE39_08535 [bacterium (candidate division B38) B3_B38]|nr:MAG: hypothetical protein CEE39_08535 [bacterium (candidate division B38) B3_B38]
MEEKIDLEASIEMEDEEGTWFRFSEELEFKGFELKLRYLDPRTIDRLRRRCITVRRGREELDEDKLFRLATEYTFVGFRGLTVAILKRLMPVKQCKTPEGRVLKDDEEVPFTPQNALFLRENSYAIRQFINEKQLEWKEFYEAKQEAERKNSSSSAGGKRKAT